VLGECGLVGRADEISGGFAALGIILCASSMLKKARQREKEIKEFVGAKRLTAVIDRTKSHRPCRDHRTVVKTGRGRKGRKGVATAAFSLREKTESMTKAGVQTNGSGRDLPPVLASLTKVRILPSLPCLKRLRMTPFSMPTPSVASEWNPGFARGWREGLKMVTATRMRLFMSRPTV
jgi:hypothetical protein